MTRLGRIASQLMPPGTPVTAFENPVPYTRTDFVMPPFAYVSKPHAPAGRTDYYDYATGDRLAGVSPSFFVNVGACSPVETPPARVAFDEVMRQRELHGLSNRCRH